MFTGSDGLSAKFLKAISNEISVPIARIFNDSLKAGVFPSQWKQSHITPIFIRVVIQDTLDPFLWYLRILAKILEKNCCCSVKSVLGTAYSSSPTLPLWKIRRGCSFGGCGFHYSMFG